MNHLLVAAALAATALGAGCHRSAEGPQAPPPSLPRAPAEPSDGGAAEEPPAPTDGGTRAETPPPTARPAKVRIWIRTAPPKVKVTWGKLKLGVTPLPIDRPRESGPMDLVLRLDGYLPLHTRAYTNRSENLSIKMTKLQDRMTVFGARAELPPPAPPDGGAPPQPPSPTGAPPTPPPPTVTPPHG